MPHNWSGLMKQNMIQVMWIVRNAFEPILGIYQTPEHAVQAAERLLVEIGAGGIHPDCNPEKDGWPANFEVVGWKYRTGFWGRRREYRVGLDVHSIEFEVSL
jgi:hypothetical protein